MANRDDILEALLEGYNEARAIAWLRKKFPYYDSSSAAEISVGITKNEKTYFKCAHRLGFVTSLLESNKSPVERPLLVVAVEMNRELSDRTSRNVQFDLCKRLLKETIATGGHGLKGFPSQGIFFFYDKGGRFRISLVTGEVKNRKFLFNEAKRQSFFVCPGAANNIVKRRLSGNIKTFANLKEAFSVEALTKEFYEKLFEWYLWAMDKQTGVIFPNDVMNDKDDREHLSEALIRLVTRLMFIWFIKQKKIVPEALFDAEQLKTILKDFDPTSREQNNYYRVILQNLFFATLNCQPEKRDFVKKSSGLSARYGIKTFYRYYSELQNPRDFKDSLMANIPFLNCALFDCLDRVEDQKRGLNETLLDGFSETKKRQANLPNALFFHEARGIISLFNLFEFTVDENNADDCDIALDPELLGKVFENLLGAFNPETQETARKATGSFYTPREIVDYMVEESLKRYLQTKVPSVTPQKLALLFDRFKTADDVLKELSDAETNALLDALYACRILDPACGSGAFPMGILHCMVHLFSRLDPLKSKQQMRLLKRYEEDKKRIANDDISEKEREEYLAMLKEQWEEGKLHPDYARKLYIIENCIYGVDIQPIATQISKLRFFISLLCDQLRGNFDPTRKNNGLLSLPNLEAKFVCANTLIPLPKVDGSELALAAGNVKTLREQLQHNRHRIFGARTATAKARWKEKDLELRDAIREMVKKRVTQPDAQILAFNEKEIARLKKERLAVAAEKPVIERRIVGGDLFSPGHEEMVTIDANAAKRAEIDARIVACEKKIKVENDKATPKKESYHSDVEKLAAKVAGWDPYDQNASSNFFDAEWMFNIKDGFDVVIGNPPYIKEYTCRRVFDGLRDSPYYQGKMDLWYLFACKGIDSLSNKGYLCFIAQNNWVTSHGASKMRDKVLADSKMCQMIDFGAYMIFGESASIQTMIMLFQKDSATDNYHLDYRRLTKSSATQEDAVRLFDKSQEEASFLSPMISRASLKGKTFTFAAGEKENLLNKLQEGCILLSAKDMAQGIVFPQDFLNKKNQTILKFGKVGDGIFGLSMEEKQSLHLLPEENKLVKPYFTTTQVHRYYTSPLHTLWLIYTDSNFKNPRSMDAYPNLKAHLDKFARIITSDNKPYGLHRAREEKFFKGEKIIVQRKCAGHPSFSYSDFDAYVSATFYVIKTTRFNLKFLTGLLNSRLIEFWLRNRGKMQGDNFQVDKEPLMQIPIKTNPEFEAPIVSLVDEILALKAGDAAADTSALEAEIDKLVYGLYGLTEAEIAVVEGRNEEAKDIESHSSQGAPAQKAGAQPTVVEYDEDLE